MSRNSVTGRSRDIEISFSIEDTQIYMSLRNLLSRERQVRVMYQKLARSGLANWRQFQLTSTPVLLLVPREVLEAYRLTFFIDDAEPISTPIETILAQLEELRSKLPPEDVKDVEEDPVSGSPHVIDDSDRNTPTLPGCQIPVGRYVDNVIIPRVMKPAEPRVEKPEEVSSPQTAAPEAEVQPVTETAEVAPPVVPERKPEPEENVSPVPTPPVTPVTIDTQIDFKIQVHALPPSARAAKRKLQAMEAAKNTTHPAGRAAGKKKKEGLFEQVAQAFGLSGSRKRGKVYYQERSEAIQDDFQDKLSKLEKDYNEGYGLNLVSWDPEMLSEEETAIFILNLMVNEMVAWEKETGRATPENRQLLETINAVSINLRQTLKHTRGVSTPAPTLFPDLLAENERDLEKIQSECDAYLQRFTEKLVQQEMKHAARIDPLVFKKFLIEFVRDFLFVEIAKGLQSNTLPKRITWFLDLVDSEVIPIEIGETEVSRTHHEVKGRCMAEFESGTIVEVVSPGLQSKGGKRVSQKAVVIQAE